MAKQKLKISVSVACKHNIIQYLAKLDAVAIGYLSEWLLTEWLLTEWLLTEWSLKRHKFMNTICQRFDPPKSKLPFSTKTIEQVTSSEKR